MTEVATPHLADYDEGLFELEALDYELETHTVAVTVELPSEFQALLSGLSRDGGKDSSDKHIKIWEIDGIQSINFSDSEPGKTMVFNAEPGYDATDIHTKLTEWLAGLRLRRQQTERMLASSAIKS